MRSLSTTLASARPGYNIGKNLKVTLDVFNLIDRKASDIDYYTSQLPGEMVDGVNEIHFHPVEPRTARVSFIARF